MSPGQLFGGDRTDSCHDHLFNSCHWLIPISRATKQFPLVSGRKTINPEFQSSKDLRKLTEDIVLC